MTQRDGPSTSQLTRRHFLQGSAMAGVATFLAACGTSGTGASSAPSSGASAGASVGASGRIRHQRAPLRQLDRLHRHRR